jgi:hypothetical protein
MSALVVFESMWGNTERVARAIAEGLSESGEVEIVEVSNAPTTPGDSVTLIVAGGPTHAFSMTRLSTRSQAVEKGATQGSVELGLREWLDALASGGHTYTPVIATFDTRVAKAKHIPGSAAKSAKRSAHRHGYPTVEAQSFFVEDLDGPVVEGELTRARNWGRELGELVTSE